MLDTSSEENKGIIIEKKLEDECDIPLPNKTFNVGSTPFLPAIQKCFNNPPHLIYQIAHESIATGGTNFQSYLVGELLPKSKAKYTMKRVSIIALNTEAMKEIKGYVEGNKEGLFSQLIEAYIKRIEDFKVIRFAMVNNVFKKTVHASTNISSEKSKDKKETNPEPKDEPLYVKIIKELMLSASEFCKNFAEYLRKKLEILEETDAKNQEVLLEYVTFWNKYFLSALEINSHFTLLNDAINNITEQIIPKLEKKVPKFSLWRVLVGVFRTLAYLPLHASLHKSYLSFIKMFAIKDMKLKMEPQKPKVTTVFSLEDLMKDDSSVEDSYEAGGNNLSDELHGAKVIFQSMLDMSLNEITVHYVNSKDLVIKLCQDFINPLTNVLNDIAEIGYKQYGKTPKVIEAISEVLSFLQKIFPPCMWDDIEVAGRKITLSIVKEKLLGLAQDFTKLSKQQQKEKAAGIQVHTDDKLVIPFVQALKNELGKPYFAGEEVKLFIPYLHKEYLEVYKECVEQKNAYNAALNKEKRVEDIEIAIKNKCLDLLIDEEANALFKMGGMNISEVKRMSMS